MDIKKTIDSFKKNNYLVSFFSSSEEAADYLNNSIDQKVVGFGDSQTMLHMGLYEMLSAHNTVYDPNQSTNNDEFLEIARHCLTTEIYLTSANAISENGEMVNIDGTGNRVAGSLFGHKKVFFVVSTNKIEPDLESAVFRARNTAGPRNALKYNLKTPCVANGGGKCYDCRSKDRICNVMAIYLKKMNDVDSVEIVLIDEELGY